MAIAIRGAILFSLLMCCLAASLLSKPDLLPKESNTQDNSEYQYVALQNQKQICHVRNFFAIQLRYEPYTIRSKQTALAGFFNTTVLDWINELLTKNGSIIRIESGGLIRNPRASNANITGTINYSKPKSYYFTALFIKLQISELLETIRTDREYRQHLKTFLRGRKFSMFEKIFSFKGGELGRADEENPLIKPVSIKHTWTVDYWETFVQLIHSLFQSQLNNAQ
jgi:hypothetical protein